jgi:hypothetical protein
MTATERKWAERVREWRASGTAADEYARGRGFEGSTLRWWSSRLSRGAVSGATRSKPETDVRLVRVVRASESAGRVMTVRVGSAMVDVREGFDPGLLREVVSALGGAR